MEQVNWRPGGGGWGLTELKPFQKEGVRQIYQFRGRALLGDEPGTGKTIQTLDWIRRIPNHRPVIIVTPSSMKWTWQTEALFHFNIPCSVLEGNAKKVKVLQDNIIVLNYDILTSWLPSLLKIKPKTVVFDECFLPITKIITNKGLLPIGEIVEKRLSVKVLSRNKKGILEWRKIKHYFKLERCQALVKVMHENGSLICTENHKIWTTNRGYVEAKDLHSQDSIVRVVPKRHLPQRKSFSILQPVLQCQMAMPPLQGKVRVIKVEGIKIHKRGSHGKPQMDNKDCEFVYCLHVEKNHNFIADDILVSNCHFIKSPSAKRTKASLKLASIAKSVIGLSGTPLTNRPIELWTVLKAIRPDLFPSREKFAWRFCKPRFDPRFGWIYDGATNLPLLHKILKRELLIRRLKKDVLPELPDKTRQVVSFRLKSYTEYNKAQHDFLNWLKGISAARANRAKKSQALTKVGYLLRLVARLKLEWTAKWIEEFFISHPGEKLVALTMHTFVIDYLAERFRARSVIIDGRVTGRKREETVRQFQSNRRFDLLLGNWIAAGVGITLHAAHNAAALDLPWTPGDLLQGEDRIHRIGQKKDVVVHYLTALDTIEEKQIKVLRKKSKILDAILNGEGSADDFDLFDEILREMQTTR